MGLAPRTQLGVVAVMLALLAFAGCGSSTDAKDDRSAGSTPTEKSKNDPDKKSREPVNGEEGKSVLEGEPRKCTAAEPLDPAEAESLLPAGIHLPDGATYLSVKADPEHVTITASVEGTTPTKLKTRYLAEVEAAGYKIERQDDEGFEAEVYFAFAAGRPGTLQFVKSACPPDTVRVVVSYLKNATTTTSP